MAKAAPLQTSFNGGELSPLLGGRTDLSVYANGVAEMLNFVPTIQGAALKRSGTRIVAEARTAVGAARLIDFVFSATQAYVIEATDGFWRFYTNNGRIEAAGVPYEIAVPYLAGELARLSYWQSNDVVYLAHPSRRPHALSRTSATTFAIAPSPLKNGPFKDQNTDEAVTVLASATTGTVTLTASAAIFQAGHVGALFRVEAKDFASVPAWEPGITVEIGEKRRSEGKVYTAEQVPVSKRTGTIQPIHTEGSEWDGMGAGKDINDKDAGGVKWGYLHDRIGILQIATVALDGLSCTATVQRRLPDSLTTAPTYRWAHALFSDAEGWPETVCLWNERKIYTKGATIVGSVVGDLDNFAERDATGRITSDQAFRQTLANPDPILWVAPDRQLIIGTARREYAIGPMATNAAPGPGNLQAPTQSFYGSSPVRPVQVGSKTIFVQRAGRKIRESGYDFSADRYLAPDVTVRAEHITKFGVTELGYQQEPMSLLWAVRDDGVLLSFTYSEEQEVRGWSRHVLAPSAAGAAHVESIACIPDPLGGKDQLWLLTRRVINGAPRAYVERLETFWSVGDDVRDAFFVDCGLNYSGPEVQTLSGLEHLEGETVAILADGATHPSRKVVGGSVTLDRKASKIAIGLLYTARLKTMRLEAGAVNGTAQTKIKKITKLALRLLDTLGLRVGPSVDRLDETLYRSSAVPMGQQSPTYSGDHIMDYPGDFERDAQIVMESAQPLPMIVLAIAPGVDTRD